MKSKKEILKTVTNFDQLLDAKYGKIGTGIRNEFESSAQRFYISEVLKESRKKANLTQEALAEKVGTKKSYISRLENGKGNITLETLIKVFETGLERKVGIIID